MTKSRATSDILEEVVDESTEDSITVGHLIAALHERGFGIGLALFSLPLCQPIPIPGLATALSLPLFVIAVQMVMRKHSPWMPDFVARKRIPRKKLASVIVKLSPYLRKIESFLKPRMISEDPVRWEVTIGAVVLVTSLILFAPIPVGKFIPAWGVFAMALGLLSRDGLAVMIGMAICLTGDIIELWIAFAGASVLNSILGG
jgi:hypothetical protein